MNIRKIAGKAAVLVAAAVMMTAAVSAESIPTAGTGTVVENTTADSSSREFFTIKAADGSTFYVVVDKTKSTDNVYLLTPVTESTLQSLAESAAAKSGGTVSSASSADYSKLFGGSTSSAASSGQTAGGASTPAKSKAKTAAGVSTQQLILMGVVFLLVIGGGYYVKIYKPRHKKPAQSGEEDSPEYGEDEDGEEADEDDADEPEEESAPAGRRRAETAAASRTGESPTETDEESEPSEEESDEDDAAPSAGWKAPDSEDEDE